MSIDIAQPVFGSTIPGPNWAAVVTVGRMNNHAAEGFGPKSQKKLILLLMPTIPALRPIPGTYEKHGGAFSGLASGCLSDNGIADLVPLHPIALRIGVRKSLTNICIVRKAAT